MLLGQNNYRHTLWNPCEDPHQFNGAWLEENVLNAKVKKFIKVWVRGPQLSIPSKIWPPLGCSFNQVATQIVYLANCPQHVTEKK